MSNRFKKKNRTFPPKPPPGKWTEGIQNVEIAGLVGQLLAYLPHIEERMIAVLARLLGHPAVEDGPARQVFRAVISAKAKVDLLKALVSNAYINQTKPELFEDVIELFEKVTLKRHRFAHGLWFTHETGRVFLAPATTDVQLLLPALRKEVSSRDVVAELALMQQLVDKISGSNSLGRPRAARSWSYLSKANCEETGQGRAEVALMYARGYAETSQQRQSRCDLLSAGSCEWRAPDKNVPSISEMCSVRGEIENLIPAPLHSRHPCPTKGGGKLERLTWGRERVGDSRRPASTAAASPAPAPPPSRAPLRRAYPRDWGRRDRTASR